MPGFLFLGFASPDLLEFMTDARQKVGFSVDQRGFVTAFPQGASALVAVVVVLDVVPPQHLHGSGQALLLMRCDQQMNMVSHQHIGMNIAAVRVAGWLQIFQGRTGNRHQHRKSRCGYCPAQSHAAVGRVLRIWVSVPSAVTSHCTNGVTYSAYKANINHPID